MARTPARPADAGAAAPLPPAPPVDQALLAEVLADAEQARDAFSVVVQLFLACDPTHQVCAADLGRLLLPIWSQFDQACNDLASATHPFH